MLKERINGRIRKKDKEVKDLYNNDYNYNGAPQKPGKKPSPWKKGLMVFLIVLVCVIVLGAGCSRLAVSVLSTGSSEESFVYTEDYIGVLEINGVMGDSEGSSPYNQEWLLKRIDEMKKDSRNRGIMLSINTPGGAVYDIDELYLKITDYKESTGRPVYTYMRDMAASGGYYIAAPSDKIYANRNTWTGSIGVTVGTFVDVSELLENMGVKTVTITAGENKAMGSAVEPMTKEQLGIFQGLVDEAYEQFTEIVAEGRDMELKDVKKLADGRIYTAKQAVENGLVDEIGTLEDALSDMKKRYELDNCKTPVMTYEPEEGFLSMLLGKFNPEHGPATEAEQVMALMEKNNKFSISYLANIER